MLSEIGTEYLLQFIPCFADNQIYYYKNSPELTDDMVETLIAHYSDKFSTDILKEREALLTGIMNGISFAELDHCADICMKNKQKPPYLHHKSVNGQIDTSETIRLYCLAYKSGESLTDMQHLDDMVECLEKAENLAECYNVGTGVPCAITDMDDLDCYCLTPSHLEEIFDYSDNFNKPTIGIVYYVDFENLQISGEIMVGYPDNHFVTPMDLRDELDPFLIRQFNSFNNLSTKINECYKSGFIARSLNVTRSELNKAIEQNNDYMGQDFKFKDVVFGVNGNAYRFNDMYMYADKIKPVQRNSNPER